MISFKISSSPAKISSCTIVFCEKNFNFTSQKKIFPTILSKIDALVKNNIKKDFFSINYFENEEKMMILVDDKGKKDFAAQCIGGQIYSRVNNQKNINILFCKVIDDKNSNNFYYNFFLGFYLKSYKFLKYKTSLLDTSKDKITNLNLITNNKKFFLKLNKKVYSLVNSVFFARNLVSEPANILNPEKFVKEIKKLNSLGVKIRVYGLDILKKIGMNAIIGVSQGSKNLPFFVIMEWRPKNSVNKKPISFVGKGVCFDTGGISLKPAKFMEDMKYDMAGAAAVVGLIKNLSLNKINKYVIGAVALVENMPSGSAQRPGDVVKSYSGKTIEILNTDAEGRLILADALHYVEKHYNPDLIVDLATLTGAMVVSLGNEYAGIFSNNDNLANKLIKSGEVEGEKLWKFPLHKNYDELMNSEIADVQNINYSGGAGSITAAQFLQRFISKNTPWAHLDIAGMAWTKKDLDTIPKGATGFGVKLLTNFVENYN